MEKYVDSKVWLRVPGGVVGWDLVELNAKIDEFNSFSWAEDDGNDYQGFAVLWKSKLDSEVHIIRKR